MGQVFEGAPPARLPAFGVVGRLPGKPTAPSRLLGIMKELNANMWLGNHAGKGVCLFLAPDRGIIKGQVGRPRRWVDGDKSGRLGTGPFAARRSPILGQVPRRHTKIIVEPWGLIFYLSSQTS